MKFEARFFQNEYLVLAAAVRNFDFFMKKDAIFFFLQFLKKTTIGPEKNQKKTIITAFCEILKYFSL